MVMGMYRVKVNVSVPVMVMVIVSFMVKDMVRIMG